MNYSFKKEGKFNYVEIGEGRPIIILHGLMGGLSNFSGVTKFFNQNGYMVVLPELPLYSMPLLNTNVKSFAVYLKEFIDLRGYNDVRNEMIYRRLPIGKLRVFKHETFFKK